MNDELVRHVRSVMSHLLSDVATEVRRWERVFTTTLLDAEGGIDTSATAESPTDPSEAEIAGMAAASAEEPAPLDRHRELRLRAAITVGKMLRDIPQPPRTIEPGDTAQRERFLHFRVLRVILIAALALILEDAETPRPTEGGGTEA